jgi:hypothetical protein
MRNVDLIAVMRRLEAAGHRPIAPSPEALAAAGWLARVPRDHGTFVHHFGGRSVEVMGWTLPGLPDWPQLEEAFRAGDAPAHLLPFAEQDGTWFMAFDLGRDPPQVVEWDHERGAAEEVASSFCDWLAGQLEEEASAERDEADHAARQRRWAREHIPFCDTPLGRRAALLLARREGDALRDVLLDLHLQYTFESPVVLNNGICFAGLLHFTDASIGCWRCGAMGAPEAPGCLSCGEPQLLDTHARACELPRQDVAREECFGLWAARHVDVDAPVPVLVTSVLHREGVPFWARLPAFGGSRDPRVRAADPESDDWEPSSGDHF